MIESRLKLSMDVLSKPQLVEVLNYHDKVHWKLCRFLWQKREQLNFPFYLVDSDYERFIYYLTSIVCTEIEELTCR